MAIQNGRRAKGAKGAKIQQPRGFERANSGANFGEKGLIQGLILAKGRGFQERPFWRRQQIGLEPPAATAI
jgi:hypothetical protein